MIVSKFTKNLLLSCTIICLFYACDNAPQMPKPSTYLRIDIQKPTYSLFNDKEYPFYFDIPDYAEIQKLNSHHKSIKWFNINFKKYNFVANVSFIPLTSDSSLRYSINDCYNFLNRHEKLSGGIIQQDYSNTDKKVYGTTFEIKGKDVVSPYQFYLTDSSKYFVRLALNSNFIPNNDSCEAVITQLKKDLNNIINTFYWR